MDITVINLTPENIAEFGVCGYKDAVKHKEVRNKIDWFTRYYAKGLKTKIVFSEKGGYQGMLEYIPGEFAHRPVNAEGYMFIHCVFVGFKNDYKGKGYASLLLDECIQDAKKQAKKGVAVVTRKGAFMASNEIFVKKGFEIVDKAKPDFELLVLKFDSDVVNPSFKSDILNDLSPYQEGLTIMRSPQCPYTEKNVNAIIDSAKQKFKLKPKLVDLNDSESAQNTPCAFGTFCIIYNGEVISHHPISNTRFENIMNKMLG